MNLLDIIEKAVGSEYFDGEECSLLNSADQKTDINLSQVPQPNANKIVFIQ